jgi:hypothetical protein
MSITLCAKELLKDKFWVVEDTAQHPVGVVSAMDESFIFSNKNGVVVLDNVKQLKSRLGAEIAWVDFSEQPQPALEAYGYPTSVVPHEMLYDVKHKMPLFTKSSKSKSLYCAGYFLLKFDKGWAKAFCPKFSTVQQYQFCGPFFTKQQMVQRLRALKQEQKLNEQ